jgi:hypothetical protein
VGESGMSEHPQITVYDGKYTLIMEPTNLRALRYDEPWRDLVGDGFVMALGQEIIALREKLAQFEWVAGLYDDRTLTQDEVAAELADYRMILERVSAVYCHATGGLLSKPNYDVHVMTSAIDDYVERLIEDEIAERNKTRT